MEEAQKESSRTAANQHEGRGPYLLVNGEKVSQEETAHQHEGAHSIHFAEVLFHQELADEEADEGVSHSGKGRKKALGVYSVVGLIHVIEPEDSGIHFSQNVLRAVHIAVSKKQDGRIDGEDAASHPAQPFVIYSTHNEGRQAIAQGQAHQHTGQAYVFQPHDAAAPDAFADPVAQPADAQKEDKTLQHLPGKFELLLAKAQEHGDAHHEYKGGEHKVRGGEPVPVCMVEGSEHASAGVVYDEHEGHGKAPKDIYRFYSFVHNLQIYKNPHK